MYKLIKDHSCFLYILTAATTNLKNIYNHLKIQSQLSNKFVKRYHTAVESLLSQTFSL